jgi:hypothetical protein
MAKNNADKWSFSPAQPAGSAVQDLIVSGSGKVKQLRHEKSHGETHSKADEADE